MLLPSAYLGNLHYFARLIEPDARIDLHEHYLKQSWRNRCDILSGNGPMSLVVPVYHSKVTKSPVRDIRIDNSKRWQHRHWQALVSAYRNSPYFEHYEDRLRPFYERPFFFLVDLNLGLQEVVLEILGHSAPIILTETYVEHVATEEDMRLWFSPKLRLQRPDTAFTPPLYHQVFGERFSFIPNLSVIDLLCCEGPTTLELLKQSLQTP